MSSHPYNPSASEITSRLFSNAPWNEATYIVSRMRDAGFVNVESEQKALTAGVGSAEMYVSISINHYLSSHLFFYVFPNLLIAKKDKG
jgi:hypothetical protein